MSPIDRREMMARVGSLGGLAAAAPRRGPERKGKVVVAGGHPGDPEYGCGGTIARLADAGHDVALLYLNEGEPEGTPRTGARVAEAKKACAILGARPLFAGQVDGAAVVDAAHYAAFRAILEAEAPDAVFAHWPIDNHADHRAVAMLAYDAWVKLGRRFALFYYEVSNGEDTEQFAPTEFVDITGAEPRKRGACFAHASQSPEKYYAMQDRVARFRGVERGVRLAEGFVRLVRGPGFALPGNGPDSGRGS
jgi:LmbE family N-acetylglucosaminyl deacetylase